MQRAYRFRLYPTREQDDLLNVLRYQSCVLYNEALDVRKKAYRTKGQTLNFVSLWSRFKADRKERPEDFGLLNATQGQQLLRRQDKAMQAFFRRLKKPHPDDKKLGFPRFKPFKRFRSLEYRHGDGCKLSDDKLYVQYDKKNVRGTRMTLLLVSQAQVENVTLLTRDDKVACYPGPIQAV